MKSQRGNTESNKLIKDGTNIVIDKIIMKNKRGNNYL